MRANRCTTPTTTRATAFAMSGACRKRNEPINAVFVRLPTRLSKAARSSWETCGATGERLGFLGPRFHPTRGSPSMAQLWYYAHDGQQQGPVTAAQLKQAADAGQLYPMDLVWKEGLANWVPASSIKGLFSAEALAAAPPPAPVSAAPTFQPAPVPYTPA